MQSVIVPPDTEVFDLGACDSAAFGPVRWVDRGAHRIATWSLGSGPTVLFIQGCGVHGLGWYPQVHALQQEFRCIWFDNVGMGESQPLDRQLSVPQMAEDARRVMDAWGIEDAHVVGHSLGGMVGLQLALDLPDRVSSLGLVCTFADGRKVAPLSWRMVRLGLGTMLGTKAMRAASFAKLVTCADEVNSPEKITRFAKLFGHSMDRQPKVTPYQLRAMRATDLSPRLSELRDLRSLILSAEQDPIAPARLSQQLHQGLSGSVWLHVQNASHALPITHSGWVNQQLRLHLRGPDVSNLTADDWEILSAIQTEATLTGWKYCKCSSVIASVAKSQGKYTERLKQLLVDEEQWQDPILDCIYQRIIALARSGKLLTSQGNLGSGEFGPAHPKLTECALTADGIRCLKLRDN